MWVDLVTRGFGLFLTWPICMIWAATAASSYTTDSLTTTAPQSPGESTTPQAIVTPDSAQAERRLTLADAFNKSDWTEADVTPAGKVEAVPAMQKDVSCGYSESVERLEFRFAQGTGRLEADVAQAMTSPSSAVRVQFTAHADGRQVDVKTIPFAGTATLSVPLAGVTVVTISVQAAKTDSSYTCGGAATALITRLVVVR